MGSVQPRRRSPATPIGTLSKMLQGPPQILAALLVALIAMSVLPIASAALAASATTTTTNAAAVSSGADVTAAASTAAAADDGADDSEDGAAATAASSCTSEESSANPIAKLWPNDISGNLNGTTMIVPIPLSTAREVIPEQYGILEDAWREWLPSFPSDMYPMMAVAVHDHDLQFPAYNVSPPDFSVSQDQMNPRFL